MPCPSPDPGHPGCACARRRRGAGFTLLEVLAAAVIMAMVYGVLAEQGVQGFVLEGDADRRLRASLVADRRLDALRTEAAGGAPPPLGVQEGREQEFGVRVEVRPFDLALVTLLPAPPEAALPDRPPRRGGPPEPSLLAPPARGREPPLRTVEVVVSWEARGAVHAVRRTDFSLDLAAATALLQEAGVEVAPAGLEGADPGREDAPESGGGAGTRGRGIAR